MRYSLVITIRNRNRRTDMENDKNTNCRFIAMIPARMGSKRIPKKNIRYLAGKPLIQYPIELCKNNTKIKEIWVNTEDEQLGKIVTDMGVAFHKRPEDLAVDTATNREFTNEFLSKHNCDYVIMVNTTSPLLRQETLEEFLEYVESNNFDTVVSVISEKAESFYKGQPINFTLKEKINSQLLEPVEKIVWALTAWKKETFMDLQNRGISPVFGGKLGRFVIPKDESCDIDTEEDWRIAEGILVSRQLAIAEKKYMDL
jgi:CMP-N-acetylneuraminic acid synthetase